MDFLEGKGEIGFAAQQQYLSVTVVRSISGHVRADLLTEAD
jgi:hypothetical protein